MKKVLIMTLIFSCCSVSLTLRSVWGQTDQNSASASTVTPADTAETPDQSSASSQDEDKFAFGKVVGVFNDQVKIKEYDFNKDADVEATYTLIPETEFGNVNSAKDLKAGDDIVVDYVEQDGKREITTLAKEAPEVETGGGNNDTVVTPSAGASTPEDASVERPDSIKSENNTPK